MQTRCPHCQTLFEIQDEQLRAASGQAHCSYCHNIFNAEKHLTKTEQRQSLAENREQAPNSDRAISLTELFEGVDLEEVDFQELNANANSTSAANGNRPSSAAEKLISDLEKSEHDGDSVDLQDKLNSAAILEQQQFNSAAVAPDIQEPVWGSTPQIPQQPADIAQIADHPTIPAALIDSSYSNTAQPRGHPLLWPVATICLLATALVQIVWFTQDRLKSYPEVRELLEYVCTQAGCSLPPWHEPERFIISSRSVRTHPQNKNALQIQLVFNNTARFAQPYPQLQLRLYDTTEKLSAQRVFSPIEYLAQPQVKAPLINPAQSVEVEMALEDPGAGITGFKIEFL